MELALLKIHTHKEAALLATLSPESLHKRAGKRCHYHRAVFGSTEKATAQNQQMEMLTRGEDFTKVVSKEAY